jgi:hypothetical protein
MIISLTYRGVGNFSIYYKSFAVTFANVKAPVVVNCVVAVALERVLGLPLALVFT